MAELDLVEESDLTLERLAKIFARAFLKTNIDSDGDLRVFTDGPSVLVSLQTGVNSFLKFLTVYDFEDNVPLEAKLALVNKINDRMILVRMSVPENNQDLLVSDYFLPFDGGVVEFQLVSALRLFAKIVLASLKEYDTAGIVA